MPLANPFYFRELPLTAPFCNRKKEIEELLSHSRNKANVVLFSPRRYGKTSLVKRIQAELSSEGIITLYVDFFGVYSLEDIASRLASRLYSYCHKDDNLLKKAIKFITSWRPVIRPDPEYGMSITAEPAGKRRGIELLEDVLAGFGKFMESSKKGFHVVIDEFQEIAELRESLQIEGIMRAHIQTHRNASYFFVGSRRRILSEIFNERKRPFYRSAINYPLGPLPLNESTAFIVEQFRRGGKICPEEIARKISEKVEGYPYYIQRVPYSIYEVSGKHITEENYSKGFIKVINEERPIYEAMLQVLAPQQIKLLSALSEEPTDKPYSIEYMNRYNLGSIGGVQGAIKRLIDLDYIEKKNGVFHVVDTVFGLWLRHLK
ncbi:MAG: AAA family ATPase [Thermodesulfovibrionales bacterium]